MTKEPGTPSRTSEVRVGLIGLGYIGKIHALAYQNIAYCFGKPPVRAHLAAVLRSRLDSESEAMQAAGFELATTDPDEFFAQKLDVVDICSPNYLHREHAERALRAGTPAYCEKPLANTLSDARALAELATATGVYTQVAYAMRYTPAIRQMKALIEAGEIGEVFNFRGRIFHSAYLDTNRPMSWRLRRKSSGGGAFMDLGAHLVDLTRYLMGDVAAVRALMRTFVCERCVTRGSDEKETVDVDDWTLATLELKTGAIGVIEATRMAAGVVDPTAFEVFGSRGSLIFQAAQPDYVQFHRLKNKQSVQGPLDLPAIAGERPIQSLWPDSKYSLGQFVNHHMAAQYDLLLNLAEGKESLSGFGAAAAAQEVIEAAYISAARDGERIGLPIS
jgi:predicted dehydrogenase